MKHPVFWLLSYMRKMRHFPPFHGKAFIYMNVVAIGCTGRVFFLGGGSVISYQLYISSTDSLWQGTMAALVQEFSFIHEKTERSQASGEDLLTSRHSLGLLSWFLALTISVTAPLGTMFLADCCCMILVGKSSDRGQKSSPLGAMFLAGCASAILDLTG